MKHERISPALLPLIHQLAENGVTKMVFEYSGCGDSGDFNFSYEEGIKGQVTSEQLQTQINDLLYNVLEEKYGGWENNDGGSGEFIIYPAETRLEHIHNENYTETNTYETEYVINPDPDSGE